MDKKDKEILLFVQDDLPLESRPFEKLSQSIGLSEEEICDRVSRSVESGLIRRFGAVLHHRKAGYTANAMVVWKVHEGKRDEAAGILASDNAVSHVYSRTGFPEWGSGLFSMIHARDENELGNLISCFADDISDCISDYRVLRTIREFKKSSMTYFGDDYDE